MVRARPIKLHIRDGKDTIFRLIGPKGRVLNMLNWDGDTLDLQDASAFADDQTSPGIEPIITENEAPDVVARNKEGESAADAVDRVSEDHPGKDVEFENPDTPPFAAPDDDSDDESTELEDTINSEIVEEVVENTPDFPDAVSEPPEPKEDTKDVDVAEDSVVDISGEPDKPIGDADLAEILNEESEELVHQEIPDVEEESEIEEDTDEEDEANNEAESDKTDEAADQPKKTDK